MAGRKKKGLLKVGWDRLDEETRSKLEKLGIRPLQRTPGKLINPRGYIPGAVGAFGTVWGKLKMTGDVAEKNMGFRPKEGAIGVVLSRRKYVDANGKVKKGIFAISLMPHRVANTKLELRTHTRTRVLAKIATKHMHDIIYPIWEPLVKNKSRKPWSGFHYFMSLNGKRVGNSLNWGKLLISNGEMQTPKTLSGWYDRKRNKIHIVMPPTMNQIGIGIFDIITADFFHISPKQMTSYLEEQPPGIFELTWKIKKVANYHYSGRTFGKCFSRFYIYTYHKDEKINGRPQYSTSKAFRIRMYKDKCVRTRGIPIVINILESRPSLDELPTEAG